MRWVWVMHERVRQNDKLIGISKHQVPVITFEHDDDMAFHQVGIDEYNPAKMHKPFVMPVGVAADLHEVSVSFDGFAKNFKKQIIDAGKKGRAYDELSATDLSATTVYLDKMFYRDAGAASHLIIGSKNPVGDPLGKCIGTQFWGSTARYEMTAAEKGYVGSFRVNFSGTRIIAAADFLALWSYKCHTNNASAGAANSSLQNVATATDPKTLRTWFRNMTKDIFL